MRSIKGVGAEHSISGVFVFLLIAMYALFSLLLVLIGAGAYQRITDAAAYNAQMRTSLTYVASKVRAGDVLGAVTVEQVDGVPVLVLEERYDDEVYYTRVYCLPNEDGQGGTLYEMLSIDGSESMDLSDGEPIAEVSAFDVRMAEGGLELNLTMPDGAERSMYLCLRSQTVI